jgi:hypothetical protein
MFHIDQKIMNTDLLAMRIMHEQVIHCYAILANCNHFKFPIAEYQTFVVVLSEYHGFSVTKDYGPVGTIRTIGNSSVSTVIEDYAIDQHLNHRSTVMLCSSH